MRFADSQSFKVRIVCHKHLIVCAFVSYSTRIVAMSQQCKCVNSRLFPHRANKCMLATKSAPSAAASEAPPPPPPVVDAQIFNSELTNQPVPDTDDEGLYDEMIFQIEPAEAEEILHANASLADGNEQCDCIAYRIQRHRKKKCTWKKHLEVGLAATAAAALAAGTVSAAVLVSKNQAASHKQKGPSSGQENSSDLTSAEKRNLFIGAAGAGAIAGTLTAGAMYSSDAANISSTAPVMTVVPHQGAEMTSSHSVITEKERRQQVEEDARVAQRLQQEMEHERRVQELEHAQRMQEQQEAFAEQEAELREQLERDRIARQRPTKYRVTGCPYPFMNGTYGKNGTANGETTFMHELGQRFLEFQSFNNCWKLVWYPNCRPPVVYSIAYTSNAIAPESGWQSLHPDAMKDKWANNSGWMVASHEMRVRPILHI